MIKSIEKQNKDDGVKKNIHSKKANKKNNNFNILSVVLIVILILVAGLLYVWKLQTNIETNINVKIKILEKKIEERDKKIQSQEDEQLIMLTQQQQNKKENLKTEKTLKEKLEILEKKILAIQHNVNEDPVEIKEEILINEIEFLIREASVYYALNKNQNITKKLLTLALERVRLIHRSETIDLTAALKKDLMNINIINRENLSEIYVSLNLVLTDVENWPDRTLLVQQPTAPQKQKNDKKETLEANWFSHFKKSTTKVLNKWFQVVHHEEKVSPLLTFNQSIFIKRSLILTLQEAQWALLQNKKDLFVNILTEAKKQIKKAFNQQDKRVKSALSIIDDIIIKMLDVKPADKLISEKAIRIFSQKIKEQSLP